MASKIQGLIAVRKGENKGKRAKRGIVSDESLAQVAAMEALKESEERFSRFMSNLPGLAWIKDTEGRYVFANDAAVEAFKTPREELYGKTDEEIFSSATA